MAHTPLWCEAKEDGVCLEVYASRTLELCPNTRENVGGVIVWKRGVSTNVWDTHPCGVKQNKMVCDGVCLVAYAPRTMKLCSKTRENVDGVIVWTRVCQHNVCFLRMAIFSCLINKNWVGGWVLFLGKKSTIPFQ